VKTIELDDCEISIAEFSDFETNLQIKGGKVSASVKKAKDPASVQHAPMTATFVKEVTISNDRECVSLANTVVSFDETVCSDADIEQLLKAHGLQRKPGS
jgi:hypothetical protein